MSCFQWYRRLRGGKLYHHSTKYMIAWGGDSAWWSREPDDYWAVALLETEEWA